MRHLLGRATLTALTFALLSQPSFAVPVPLLRPALESDGISAVPAPRPTRLGDRADVAVPTARPAQHGEETILARTDVVVPTARPARAGDDPVLAQADPPVRPDAQLDADATADDADTAALDQPAVLPLDQDAARPDLAGDDAPRIEAADHRLSCVAYTREISGLAIQGDAKTWWAHAEGIYDRGSSPVAGAVMVFAATHAMTRGHVAVVKKQVSDREIIVNHANWMNDGRIYLNMPVMDVSIANDWSRVRVWNARDNQWGSRVYPIKGFVSARAMAQS